jgi:hypothetical protein
VLENRQLSTLKRYLCSGIPQKRGVLFNHTTEKGVTLVTFGGHNRIERVCRIHHHASVFQHRCGDAAKEQQVQGKPRTKEKAKEMGPNVSETHAHKQYEKRVSPISMGWKVHAKQIVKNEQGLVMPLKHGRYALSNAVVEAVT